MSLGSAVAHLVAALTAAGIAATADPRDLTPPGVWVMLSEFDHVLLSGGITCRLRLVCVVGDVGTLDALDALSDLLNAVTGVVTPNAGVPSTAVPVYLPDNPSTPLPGIQLTVDVLDTL